MFIFYSFVYMHDKMVFEGSTMAATRSRVRHKHYRLDSNKIARAQKILRVDTETETIERALDFVLSEHERNQLAWEAMDRFLKSGVEVRDVYKKLSE